MTVTAFNGDIRASAGGPGDHRPAGARDPVQDAGVAVAADVAQAVATELAPRVRGHVLQPGEPGYDEERTGYNQALTHNPAVIVRASGAADVMAAVGFATDHGLPVGVLNSGHGVAMPAGGDAMLISTRGLRGVHVDPFTRVARVGAGATWDEVIHETAPFGLAPLSGSAPGVGAAGYVLGGGLPLLGRVFGYAADHVKSIDVVTPHGMLRQANPAVFDDLFWALRGGKGNFGVVTSMEIALFPVTRLYGGALFFRGSASPQILQAYRRWAKKMPEEMCSSVGLIRFPWRREFPEELRGRFITHVRIAYHGPSDKGEDLVRPLRETALPLRDTVAEMPFTQSGRIHDDPVDPFPLFERSICLRDLDEDAVDALAEVAGPDSTCPLGLVELRQLGGVLSRPPEVPNAVGNRDAAFLLYVAGDTAVNDVELVAECADAVMDRMAPWSTGRTNINFTGSRDASPERVRAAYSDETYRRLAKIKRAYDPENIFRLNHNIPPGF